MSITKYHKMTKMNMYNCHNYRRLLMITTTFIYIVLLSLLFIKTLDAAKLRRNNYNIFQHDKSLSSSSLTSPSGPLTTIPGIQTTPALSSFSISILKSPSSSLLCRVIGYKMYYQSGYEEEYLISGRKAIEVLDDRFYMCSENVGDNIEAIMNPECNITLLNQHGGVRMLLRNLTVRNNSNNKRFIQNVTDNQSPYFLHGNNNTQILGKPIPIGPYQLTSCPINNRTYGQFQINFHMINCVYYLPKNECSRCNTRETCEGSQCVTKSMKGIRITLLIFGQDTYDYGMNITSPLQTTINAYYKTDRTINNNTTDIVTGGYVDKDYKEESCRSTGVWIKNVVYPTYIPGKYSITLENILTCSFLGPPFFGIAPPNQNRYTLRIYRNETLIKLISSSNDPTGKIFNFTL